VQHEDDEERPFLGAAHLYGLAPIGHLERSQDPELHARTVTGS
jgi:hypothetical protein